ncbi:MAG TPA: FixH family protein [Methylophilaceae bacterium]|nr:FixH family protein [Methylophilaceae bacterium]
MTETLFGGLLAVILIFFVARRLGLSNYWSGVLGGSLPFLIYLGYSANHGQGGDVIAIHLVVFMATAGVLGVFNNMQRGKEKMHWAPRLLIAFFALLAVAMAIFVSIAANGLPPVIAKYVLPNANSRVMHTRFPGALPHDRNKLYEEHQQRIEAQRKLGWQVSVAGLEAMHSGVPFAISLTLQDAGGQPIIAEHVVLQMLRLAKHDDDFQLELKQTSPGTYGTQVTLPASGNWVAGFLIERGQDTYEMQQPVQVADR